MSREGNPKGKARAARRDRRRPTSPTELVVTAVGDTTISLAWRPATDDRRVAGYRLYQDGEPIGRTAKTQFTFFGLECGTAYAFLLEAFDDAGNRSKHVRIVSATAPCPDTFAPTTPNALVQVAASETSVSVSWRPSEDNVGVVGYGMYRGALLVAVTAEQSYTFAGLSCGMSYAIAVDAYDASANRSAHASLVVTTSACARPTAPPGPGSLRQTAQTETSVSFSWDGADGAAGFGVYQNGAQVGTTRDTSYALSGLACSSSYTVGVDAFDGAGRRSDQSSAVLTTSACSDPPPNTGSDTEPPTTPGELRVVGVADTSVELSWAAASDNAAVAGYGVYADAVRIATTAATSVTVPGLVCGRTYVFAVDAYDDAGNRSQQASETVTTTACEAAGPGGDSQAPSSPSELRLGDASETSASLRWAAAADNVAVEGYALYLNDVKVGTTSDTSFTFTGLECGRTYMIGVQAYDAAGNTSERPSAELQTATCPQPTSDAAPPSTPSALTLQSATQTSLSIAWSASTDDVRVAGYGVYRDGGRIGATTETSFALTGLSCGTSYALAVDAYDSAGNRSGQVSVTAPTSACTDDQAPAMPTNVAQSNRTQTSISLSWTASTDTVGVAGYGVYRDGVLLTTTSDTSYAFTNLTCGTSYTLAVDAYDAAGNRSGRANVSMTTSACSDTSPPSAPTGLVRTDATETTIAIAWNASTDNVGVAGYGVYRGGVLLGATAGRTFVIPALACGTSYTLGVDAYDAAGNRSSQASLTAATTACAPPPPPPPAEPTSAAAGLPLRDRLCVNVHMGYDERPYWDAAATKAALDYIGTNCVRDGLNLTGWQLAHQTESLLALERPVSLISGRGWIAENVDHARRHNIPVLAFEGVNEPYCHNAPAYNAEQGWLWMRDSQAALAQAAGDDEVYTFSMCTPDWWDLSDPLNVVPGVQNMHPYAPRAAGAWPPLGPADTYGTLDWWLANTHFNSSGRYVATEFGSDNADQWWQQQAIVAQWLNHLLRNVERSFVYELVDDGGEHFGLYASSYSDKRLAADVLHDWLALVGDATVASAPGPCQIVDPSANSHHLWLRDGAAWWLAIWTTAPDGGRTVELHCPEGSHEFRRYMPANFGTAKGGSTESSDKAASETNVFAAWTWDSPSLIRYVP